jgi:hypothetical protein
MKTKTTGKKMTTMTTKTMTANRSKNGKPTITFSALVDKLQQHYGAPASPPSTDPLELVIWENIAYLASDKRRAEAFVTLKQTIGTRPEQILAAKHSALAAIGKAGILPDVSANSLRAPETRTEIVGTTVRTDLYLTMPSLPSKNTGSDESLNKKTGRFVGVPCFNRLPIRKCI